MQYLVDRGHAFSDNCFLKQPGLRPKSYFHQQHIEKIEIYLLNDIGKTKWNDEISCLIPFSLVAVDGYQDGIVQIDFDSS